MRSLLVAASLLLALSGVAEASTPLYEDAREFSPRIRDRLEVNEYREMLPASDGNVLQLTNDSYWVIPNESDWSIGDPVLLELNLGDEGVTQVLINLRTGERAAVQPWTDQRISVQAEPSDTRRGRRLPRIDMAVFFKADARRDIVQLGAQRCLWEFDAALDSMLSDIAWPRAVRIEICGSGHPDYPYWIVLVGENNSWVNALLVRANPRKLAEDIHHG